MLASAGVACGSKSVVILMTSFATLQYMPALEELWAGPAVSYELPLGKHDGSRPSVLSIYASRHSV